MLAYFFTAIQFQVMDKVVTKYGLIVVILWNGTVNRLSSCSTDGWLRRMIAPVSREW